MYNFFFLFYLSLSFLPDFCWPELITSVLSQLQDAVSDTKNEVAKHLVDPGVSTFSMAPVKVYWLINFTFLECLNELRDAFVYNIFACLCILTPCSFLQRKDAFECQWSDIPAGENYVVYTVKSICILNSNLKMSKYVFVIFSRACYMCLIRFNV
jgi:hypothetical protein